MYYLIDVRQLNKNLEESGRVLNVGRDKNPAHYPTQPSFYDYNLKKSPELRPSGKSWNKIVVLLGRLC